MLSQGRIVIVLYTIVRSTAKKLGDVCPLVAIDFVGIEDYLFLIEVDRTLLNIRVKVIVPSLTALLTSPSANMVRIGKLLGDICPSFGAILFNQLDNGVILGLVPELTLARVLTLLNRSSGSSFSSALAHLDAKGSIDHAPLLGSA